MRWTTWRQWPAGTGARVVGFLGTDNNDDGIPGLAEAGAGAGAAVALEMTGEGAEVNASMTVVLELVLASRGAPGAEQQNLPPNAPWFHSSPQEQIVLRYHQSNQSTQEVIWKGP